MSINESKLVLHELLEDFGFNYHQVTDILRSMEGQSGKLFLAEQYQLIIDREHLLISEKNIERGQIISITENQETVLTGSGRLSFEKIERSKVSFVDDNNTAFIDFDKIQFPLTMRNWEAGDHFQPLGMKHKKKLSDFMIDEKIPLNLKKQVPLLISNNDIVWVVGYRIDDRFKITEQTVNAYKICNMLNND